MTSGNRITVTIQSNGIARRLFTVLENEKFGDLTLVLQSLEYRDAYTDPDGIGLTADHMKPVKQQKYSFHTSPDSVIGVNTVKQTIIFTDDTCKTTYHNTLAIKSGKRVFAPIFFRRYPSTKSANFDFSKKGNFESIGDYDSSQFTLIIGIFLSNKSVIFHGNPFDDYNYKDFVFKEFRLTLLWSFMLLPGHKSGTLIHMLTPPRDAEIDSAAKATVMTLMHGFRELQCINAFKESRDRLREEMIATLFDSVPKDDPERALHLDILAKGAEIARLGYYKYGDRMPSRRAA